MYIYIYIKFMYIYTCRPAFRVEGLQSPSTARFRERTRAVDIDGHPPAPPTRAGGNPGANGWFL